MISNNNFAGITENSKPSSKVLRPPGGGSSNIFGTDLPQTPRSVKNHMQSNIFSCEKNSSVQNNGDQPRRAQKNMDSYSRLFGEPQRPITPANNHMKSSIPFGGAKTEVVHKLLSNGHHHINSKSGSVSSASSSVSSSTENLKINGVSKTDGNPVTGEGYKPGNDMNNSVPNLNGANQVINKNRIPPGGYSSGLW